MHPPDLAPLEGVTADVPLIFPYVPGLLAFREGPAILAAWEKLHTHPDLLMAVRIGCRSRPAGRTRWQAGKNCR
jgi:deoxyinosine 3'endonuclease (endonuclease V)